MNTKQRRIPLSLVLVAMAALCLAAVDGARAQEEVCQVTLMAGAPRMVGESIRPLQTILSGRQLQTGEKDAAGLLAGDVVFHVGVNSNVIVLDEPGVKRLVLERGFVVFYTDPGTRNEVVVETPFGRLTAHAGTGAEGGSGWYSVRHDAEQPNVSPAVSTFAAIEGPAEVAGTVPVAGPHQLKAGQRWRIVQGQIPGPPEAGDERAAADELREMLHRQAAEVMRTQVSDITRLTGTDLGGTVRRMPTDVVAPEQQRIIDASAAVQNRPAASTIQPVTPTLEEQPPVEAEPYAFGDPTSIAAGAPDMAVGQFVSYAGTPANPDWNASLTAVDGNPAFQPVYVTQFVNAGFSYIQLAGPDAQVATNNGEAFLAAETGRSSGWAYFTPMTAVADTGYNPQSGLAGVVTEGFRAIAQGEHLAGGGTMGGDGSDPASAFAVVSGSLIQLNPDLPPGYPQLDRAADTTGLTVNGQAVSDQIAALGAGLDPQNLSQAGPQLVFLSSSDTDAVGNRFNFDGEPIVPTDLNLPGDRQVEVDTSGAASLASPVSTSAENSVGIQFAATGETIAIIHHTGLADPDEDSLPTSEHFEVVRGEQYSIVQWREGGRVTDGQGEPVEVEDLNDDPELRNELFALISEEVNNVVPPGRHTVAGPAIAESGDGALRALRRQPGRLVRPGDDMVRQRANVRPLVSSATVRSLKLRPIKPASGRLVREVDSGVSRRHLGRVPVRK